MTLEWRFCEEKKHSAEPLVLRIYKGVLAEFTLPEIPLKDGSALYAIPFAYVGVDKHSSF